MKPSLKRDNLRNEGKTILRSQAFHTSNGMFWHIVEYNGKGWQRWHFTCFYKTQQFAEEAINTYCIADSSLINDIIFQ